MNKRAAAILLPLGIALATAAVAAGSTITTTATVTGTGAVSLAAGATASFSDTLDGTDQTVTYQLPLTVVDARGTGGGWNLTVTSTQFTTGTRTLATSASSLTTVTSACNAGSTCTNPTNAITLPIALPAGATAPTAVKFFNSAANTGMGAFTVTPTVSVTIPGNAYAGSYQSTVTVAVSDFASSPRNVRPNKGLVPSTVKKSAETWRAVTRSASPAPIRLKPDPREMAIAENVLFSRSRSWKFGYGMAPISKFALL